MRCVLGVLFLLSACGAGTQRGAHVNARQQKKVERPSHPALAAAFTGIATCDRATARVATLWNADTVAKIEVGLSRAAPSYGAATAGALSELLTRHSIDWATLSAGACRLHLGEKKIAAPEFRRRKACYDDALGGFARYLGWLEEADTATAEHAFDGLWELQSRLGRCEQEAIFYTFLDEGSLPDTHAAIGAARLGLALGRLGDAAAALTKAEHLAGNDKLFRPALLLLRGRLLAARGQADEADTLIGAATDYYQQRVDADGLADAYAAHGELLAETERADAALWDAQQALTQAERAHGASSAIAAARAMTLAGIALRAGDAATATEAATQAATQIGTRFGAAHPMAIEAVVLVARAQHRAGRSADALLTLQGAVDTFVSRVGEAHPRVADFLALAAGIRAKLGNERKALSLYQSAARIHNRAHGTNHPTVAADLSGAGEMFRRLGRPADAAQDFERALKIYRQLSDQPRPALARALKDTAAAFIDAGRPPKRVLGYLEDALAIEEQVLGPDHFQLAIDLLLFGRYHSALGQHELAYDSYSRALERLTDLFGPTDKRVKMATAMVEKTIEAMGARH